MLVQYKNGSVLCTGRAAYLFLAKLVGINTFVNTNPYQHTLMVINLLIFMSRRYPGSIATDYIMQGNWDKPSLLVMLPYSCNQSINLTSAYGTFGFVPLWASLSLHGTFVALIITTL